MTATSQTPELARVDSPVIGVAFDTSDGPDPTREQDTEPVITVRDLNFWYGSQQALFNINMDISERSVTSIIGPSGCGKSTLLRCINRMNDLVETTRVQGRLMIQGQNVYGPKVDPVAVRRHIGMVFQKPNPFPKSIFDNVAFGLRIRGRKRTGDIAETVEWALRQAYLWDEVKDKLKKSGSSLSGGQQQRLCLARALATKPKVLLMDEPCSALDPIATGRIEDLITQLKNDYTIVIVTHSMQQAARVSDRTAFLCLGELIEYGLTRDIFTNPGVKQTEDYITGRFG
jgi:phosphate transport system ATP-binding protein